MLPSQMIVDKRMVKAMDGIPHPYPTQIDLVSANSERENRHRKQRLDLRPLPSLGLSFQPSLGLE